MGLAVLLLLVAMTTAVMTVSPPFERPSINLPPVPPSHKFGRPSTGEQVANPSQSQTPTGSGVGAKPVPGTISLASIKNKPREHVEHHQIKIPDLEEFRHAIQNEDIAEQQQPTQEEEAVRGETLSFMPDRSRIQPPAQPPKTTKK